MIDRYGQGSPEDERTGTKNSTPVTIDVNAVPENLREYMFPRPPTTNAPMAETTSERLKIKWLAALFAVYAAHEMTTMTTRSNDRHGCKFASELRIEKAGTIMNCVQNGKGCRYHGNHGGR